MFAIVVSGPPGAGKTSVLTALIDALSDDDVPHAAIEVEMLVWAHPAITDDQWMRHVQSASALYREEGYGLLLVAQTVESDEDMAQLVVAIGADEHFAVRLEAQPTTLAARILEREPEGWSGRLPLADHARHLATTMSRIRGFDLVLSTEGQRPEAVAAHIRDACPDRLTGAAPL